MLLTQRGIRVGVVGISLGMLTVVGIGQAAVAQAQSTNASALPDDEATNLMRSMGRFIASQRQFTFNAEVVYDRPIEAGGLVEVHERHMVSIRRPGSLKATVLGEGGARVVALNDGVLTVADPATRRYFEASAEGSLSDAVDVVVIDLGLSLPGSDFVHETPGSLLLSEVSNSEYLGVTFINDDPCHHLWFSQDGLEWQVWISTGVHPTPQRLVLNYIDRPGSPRFCADFEWTLSGVPYDDAVFTSLGHGDFTRVNDLQELGSIGGTR